MSNANFTIQGAAGPYYASHGETIALALVDPKGVKSVQWEIFGHWTNDPQAAPIITKTGTPAGVTATLDLLSVSDGYGASYGIRCTVTDNNNDRAQSTAGIYVRNVLGISVGFPGETTQEDPVNGWLPRMNLASAGSGNFSFDLDAVLQNGNDAGGHQIKGVLDPTDPQDADTLAARTAAIQLNSFANNAALLAVTPTAGRIVTTRSQSDPNDPFDGGSGTWRALTGASAATYVHDEGTMLVAGDGSSAWQRVFEGQANGKWWGARGDGETDDTAAVHAAFDWGHANKRALYFPIGQYLVSEGWSTSVTTGDLVVYGEKCGQYVWTDGGGRSTAFKLTSTDGYDFFVQISHNGTYHFENLEFTSTSTPDQKFFRLSAAFGYLRFKNLLFANMGHAIAWEDGFYTHNAVFEDIIFRYCGVFWSESALLKCTGIAIDNIASENGIIANSNKTVMDMRGIRMIDAGIIILEGGLPEADTWTILKVGCSNGGDAYGRSPLGRIQALHIEWPGNAPLSGIDAANGTLEIGDCVLGHLKIRLTDSSILKIDYQAINTNAIEDLIEMDSAECGVIYETYNTRNRDSVMLADLPFPLNHRIIINNGYHAPSGLTAKENQAIVSPNAPSIGWEWDGGYVRNGMPYLYAPGGLQPSVDATYGRRLEVPFVGDGYEMNVGIGLPFRDALDVGQQVTVVGHVKAPALDAGEIQVQIRQQGMAGGIGFIQLASEEEVRFAYPTAIQPEAVNAINFELTASGVTGTPGPVHVYALGFYIGKDYPKKLYPSYPTNIVTYWTAAPTGGTWNRGDIIYNTAPSASGSVGWVCTAAGTPGTWNTFGSISA